MVASWSRDRPGALASLLGLEGWATHRPPPAEHVMHLGLLSLASVLAVAAPAPPVPKIATAFVANITLSSRMINMVQNGTGWVAYANSPKGKDRIKADITVNTGPTTVFVVSDQIQDYDKGVAYTHTCSQTATSGKPTCSCSGFSLKGEMQTFNRTGWSYVGMAKIGTDECTQWSPPDKAPGQKAVISVTNATPATLRQAKSTIEKPSAGAPGGTTEDFTNIIVGPPPASTWVTPPEWKCRPPPLSASQSPEVTAVQKLLSEVVRMIKH